MKDFDDLQTACLQLSLAAAFHAVGRLDAFLAETGDELYGDPDFFYANYYMILSVIADFFDMKDRDDNCVTCFYFSDESIRTYFRFAWEHAKQLGVPLKQDPYYRNALSYFSDTMLTACPYCCWFRLVTQAHHQYGCGLSVWIGDEQFNDAEQLVFGLLDVIGYFKDNVALLRAEGKIPSNGVVLPFDAQSRHKKEAA